MAFPSPFPKASEDEDDDGDSDDDEDKDEDSCSSGDKEMTAWVTCPLSFVSKRGISLGMRVVMFLKGELEFV